MGKAIIISGADFSAAGIGLVTPTEYRELLSITLEEGATVGNRVTIDVTYNPNNATFKELIWSIESGSEYATISNGVLTVLQGADNSPVTVKAVSAHDESIYDTITVYVTRDTTNDYDAEVEYLETDGNAVIDTGVNTDNTTQFDINMHIPSASVESIMPFGARKSFSPLVTVEFVVAKDVSRWYYRYNNATPYLGFGSTSEVGDYHISNLTAANKVDFNGKSITSTSGIFDTGINFHLFAVKDNEGVYRGKCSGVRYYSAKIYSNGTLMRDYIPVRKNGVGMLFDKVSGTLFGNANSEGAFTYGNDKNA